MHKGGKTLHALHYFSLSRVTIYFPPPFFFLQNSFFHAIGADNHKYYSVIYEYFVMNMEEIESSPEGIFLKLDSSLDNVVARAFPTCCNSPIYDEALAKRHRALSEKYGDIHEPRWESEKSFHSGSAIADAFVSNGYLILTYSQNQSATPTGRALISIWCVEYPTPIWQAGPLPRMPRRGASSRHRRRGRGGFAQ